MPAAEPTNAHPSIRLEKGMGVHDVGTPMNGAAVAMKGVIDLEPGDGEEVQIYTDGACSGNPGPGGWAAVLRWRDHERELSGAAAHTTNQRMELTAAVEALRTLKRPVRAVLFTDSAYLANAFRQRWLDRWERNGWQTAKQTPVENQDLWQELLALTRRHSVRFVKVRGHASDALNNRCDALARAALKSVQPEP